jgi:hypothetical protein
MDSREAAILDHLLRPDFPGRDALRAQVELALVRPIDADGSLAFDIVPTAPPVIGGRRIPIEGEHVDRDGTVVHVLLHVVNGYLAEFDVYREDSGPVQSLAEPERVEVILF